MERINDVKEQLANATTVLVIQAENPDGDSLGAALALEAILSDLGKQVRLYCPVIIPRHLRFLQGWDRVSDELPKEFDLSIIVDTSSATLLERVLAPEQLPQLQKRPVIVMDHHDHANDLPFESINVVSTQAVSTGELIYEIAQQLDWPIGTDAAEFIVASILFDSLGLTTAATTARSVHIVGELVEKGVSLNELDNRRRELMKKSAEILDYKARLIQRITYHIDGRLAMVVIPWEEIEAYSDEYNPSMLVIEEMRMVKGVELAAAFKTYPDGKITCKLRANASAPIARDIAGHFGGGGHPQAAGFKVRGAALDQIQQEFIQAVSGSLKTTAE